MALCVQAEPKRKISLRLTRKLEYWLPSVLATLKLHQICTVSFDFWVAYFDKHPANKISRGNFFIVQTKEV